MSSSLNRLPHTRLRASQSRPINRRLQLFALHGAACEPLNRWAVLNGNASPEPRPHAARLDANRSRKSGLPSELLNRSLQGGDLGRGCFDHSGNLPKVDIQSQLRVDQAHALGLGSGMTEDQEKAALGQRLAMARKLAGYTLESAAAALTNRDKKIGKAGVGAWEVGRTVPDAVTLKRLSRLYEVSADKLLGLAADMHSPPELGVSVPQAVAIVPSKPDSGARRVPSTWSKTNHPSRRATDKKGRG